MALLESWRLLMSDVPLHRFCSQPELKSCPAHRTTVNDAGRRGAWSVVARGRGRQENDRGPNLASLCPFPMPISNRKNYHPIINPVRPPNYMDQRRGNPPTTILQAAPKTRATAGKMGRVRLKHQTPNPSLRGVEEVADSEAERGHWDEQLGAQRFFQCVPPRHLTPCRRLSIK